MKGFYRFLHRTFAPLIRLIFNIKVEGRENEPNNGNESLLVCANHLSAGDAVWLCAALKHHHPHFMAKAELFKIPLLRGLINFFGAYPVERGGADVSSVRNTISFLKNGVCVGMFPQGTRQKEKDPAQTSVKNGAGMIAVRSKVDVLPVMIVTKGFKSTLFGRKKIIIRAPIPYKVISEMHESGVSYHHISQYIFKEICALNCPSLTEGAKQ